MAAKAYPAIRELQVLKDLDPSYRTKPILASICPRNVNDETQQDFGYNPAITATVDAFKGKLQQRCLSVELPADYIDSCTVVEAVPEPNHGCDSVLGRSNTTNPSDAMLAFSKLQDMGRCGSDTMHPCDESSWTLCEIQEAGDECLTSTDPAKSGLGWCYIDAAKGIGNPQLVADCEESQSRLIRFVSNNPDNPVPAKHSTAIIMCSESHEGPLPPPPTTPTTTAP